MPVLNVNPTRMELTRLKRKLSTAQRGHRLLKDKRDEMIRQFLDTARETSDLRQETEMAVKEASAHIAIAMSIMTAQQVKAAVLMPKQKIELDIAEKNIMSVTVPVFEIANFDENAEDIYSWGFAFTSGELDEAVKSFAKVSEKLIKLAQGEKTIQLLADEIERTRRRVNALEHIVIPRYMETIRYIEMKIEENERSNITRLMKVKNESIKMS